MLPDAVQRRAKSEISLVLRSVTTIARKEDGSSGLRIETEMGVERRREREGERVNGAGCLLFTTATI